MDNLEFLNPEQVEEQYEKLIDEYNEVLIKSEEIEEIDDNLQALRAVNLDRYDYMIMLDVYNCFNTYDDKETVEELTSLIEECEEEIEEYRKKLSGLNLKEHLYNYYNMEQKKEQYEIQIKCCEKYLEKSKKTKEMEKKREKIRPASPRRNLTENSMRPMSPRLTGGSYTPSKRKQEESSVTPLAKLEPIAPVKVTPVKPPSPITPPPLPPVPKKEFVTPSLPPPPPLPPMTKTVVQLSSSSSEESENEVEEETSFVPPELPPPPPPKKRVLKPKSEPVALPALPIPVPVTTENDASQPVAKKRGGARKKKVEE
jgi:hypothetical protein